MPRRHEGQYYHKTKQNKKTLASYFDKPNFVSLTHFLSKYLVQLCIVGTEKLAHIWQRHELNYTNGQRLPEKDDNILNLERKVQNSYKQRYFGSLFLINIFFPLFMIRSDSISNPTLYAR